MASNSLTDTLKFNSSEMFEKIRAGLPKDKGKTHNLLECKDDILYAWNSSQCCLLTLNWRAAKVKGINAIKHQSLIPSTQRNFQVEKILASPEGSLIALAGLNGLSVLEIPNRWGPDGYFLDGKPEIICRTYNLHEDVFENNSHLQLLQIRWHPASATDSHLLALFSDNTIGVFDESTLKHIWRVGPLPTFVQSQTMSSPSKLGTSMLYSLGEAVVDFDIAPPRVIVNEHNDNISQTISKFHETSKMNSTAFSTKENGDTFDKSSTELSSTLSKSKTLKTIEYPIVILRANGNIYVLLAGIDTERPRLQGPLTIQPQSDDNYGVDSCSILVIPSLPATLVIAESTGKLHHALMLESELKEESFNEIDASLLIHPSEWTVHVLETLELELGLIENSNKENMHTCPIHLKRDFINEYRYFAYHNTGLHVICLNFIKQLQTFLSSDEIVGEPMLSSPSTSEYLVCTKVEDKSKINPVLGFVLLQMPSGIVLLLSSGQVISLDLIVDPHILPDWNVKLQQQQISFNENTTKLDSSIQKIMGESFVTYIKNLLKKDVTQPILSLDKTTEPKLHERYELLTQAIHVLHEQYFKKHEIAKNEIIKRIKLSRLLKIKQQQEIEYLEQKKNKIQLNAERLAEKYDDVYKKQQVINRKCQDLIRLAETSLPSNTFADKEFNEEIKNIDERARKLEKSYQQAQEKLKKQQYNIEKHLENVNYQELSLPSKQEATIKDVLTNMTAEIDSQIKELKKIQKVLNL